MSILILLFTKTLIRQQISKYYLRYYNIWIYQNLIIVIHIVNKLMHWKKYEFMNLNIYSI